MADRFRLKVVTPGKQFYEGEAEFVEFVTTEGEMGVYRNHIPMTAILAPGLLRIHEEGGAVRKAALISGFAEVLPELVTILAQIAEWPHEIDEERAKRARERAEKLLRDQSGSDVLKAELALKRALTRLEARKK